jgi:hypothetical protein
MSAEQARELARTIEFRLSVGNLTSEQFEKLSNDCVDLAAYCRGKMADLELGVLGVAS